MDKLLRQKPNAQTLRLWISKVPYAQYLGIEAKVFGDEIIFVLPADEKLQGNPVRPAVHGGVVGAFMEQAAALYLLAKMKNPQIPKTINFSLDFLRATRMQDTYAQCALTRQGTAIANVNVIAWQRDRSEPQAIARAHFITDQTVSSG